MKLELYFFETCPYCQRVLKFIQEKGITNIVTKDIRKVPEYKAQLLELIGFSQVPCLVIDGKPMLESSYIIEWLDKGGDIPELNKREPLGESCNLNGECTLPTHKASHE